MGNEDLLWAANNFNGGIAEQQQAPCGAVSGAAVALGLIHRCPRSDAEKAKMERRAAREEAASLVQGFEQEFGSIVCKDLLGYDLTSEESRRAAREAGAFQNKCYNFVQYVVEKMYQMGDRDSSCGCETAGDSGC